MYYKTSMNENFHSLFLFKKGMKPHLKKEMKSIFNFIS